MTIRFYYRILTATLLSILAVSGNLYAQSTESTSPAPVELFSINFDLSPETAIEVAKARFGCNYSELNEACYVDGTKVFQIETEMGKLSEIYFPCQAYNGCSYKISEVIDALEIQKSLKFDDTNNCLVTELGAEICILGSKTIYMNRGKFRVPKLNFD